MDEQQKPSWWDSHRTRPWLVERLERLHVGEAIAVLCARYWYRGVLSEVGADYIVLSQPRAVEVSGRATATAPETEDPIPSDLVIRVDFIEQIGQPTWVVHELDIPQKEEASR